MEWEKTSWKETAKERDESNKYTIKNVAITYNLFCSIK